MPDQPRHAAVVGAGIAGTLTAARLLQSGWSVTLLDASDSAFRQASGNPAGAFHAHLSRDDVPLSRLTRHGVRATIADLQRLTAAGALIPGVDWKLSGHYQLFDSDLDAHRMTQALERLQSLVNPISQDELPTATTSQAIAHDLGLTPKQSGLFFQQAGWVNPAAWGRAALAEALKCPDFNFAQNHGPVAAKAGANDDAGIDRAAVLTQQYRARVTAIRPEADHVQLQWQVTGSAEQRHCGNFDRVVIAAGLNSLDVYGQPGARAQGVKGQLSFWKTDQRLMRVISGAAYAIDLNQGLWLIGATFDRSAQDTSVTDAGHLWNIDRIGKAFEDELTGVIVGGRSAVRAMWPDRLPAVGPAVNEDGQPVERVWFATGFGSRGLTWAALAADLIQASWAGHDPALPQDLLSAVLPGRFFSRASNSKPTLPSLPKTR